MNLSIDQLIFQNFSKGARRMPQGLIQDLLVVVGGEIRGMLLRENLF